MFLINGKIEVYLNGVVDIRSSEHYLSEVETSDKIMNLADILPRTGGLSGAGSVPLQRPVNAPRKYGGGVR